jgi:hypothetical protein
LPASAGFGSAFWARNGADASAVEQMRIARLRQKTRTMIAQVGWRSIFDRDGISARQIGWAKSGRHCG